MKSEISKSENMNIERIKKFYIIEISIMFFSILMINIYLNRSYNQIDIEKINIETLSRVKQEINIYLDQNIDYLQVYKNSLYNTLPLSEIIEYKKISLIYDLDKVSNNTELSVSEKSLLNSYYTSTKYTFGESSLKHIKLSNNKYLFFHYLGVITVICFAILIYYILKRKKNQAIKNRFLFSILFLYFINFIFSTIKSDKEVILEANYIKNYQNLHKLKI